MVSHLHHSESGGTSTPQTRGFVWNWDGCYDLLIGFATLGRERAFRQRIADLTRLEPGESVLDVGCGTGMVAMVARQRVGEKGNVSDIDPSPQMIARANGKVVRRNLAIDFRVGVIEQFSFSDHLPDDLKRQENWEGRRGKGGLVVILPHQSPHRRCTL